MCAVHGTRATSRGGARIIRAFVQEGVVRKDRTSRHAVQRHDCHW
jgi:hypothetical protein